MGARCCASLLCRVARNCWKTFDKAKDMCDHFTCNPSNTGRTSTGGGEFFLKNSHGSIALDYSPKCLASSDDWSSIRTPVPSCGFVQRRLWVGALEIFGGLSTSIGCRAIPRHGGNAAAPNRDRREAGSKEIFYGRW